MIFRDTCIIAAVVVFAPTIAGAQAVRPALEKPVESDAGTGPYQAALQSGMSVRVMDVNAGVARSISAEIDHLIVKVAALHVAPRFGGYQYAVVSNFEVSLPAQVLPLKNDVQDVKDRIQRLQAKLAAFSPHHAGACVQEFPEQKTLDDLLNDLGSLETFGAKASFDQQKVDAEAKARALDDQFNRLIAPELKDQYDQALARATQRGTGGLKVGSVLESGVSYGFATATFTPGEFSCGRSGDFKRAIFGSVTEISQLGASGPPAVARFGAGGLFGEPRRWVSAISLGTYDSPSITDAQASITLKLGGQPQGRLGPDKLDDPLDKSAFSNWLANREPHLMDHVRSGDLWLDANVRSLSSGEPGLTGTAYVGQLTYAFRNQAFDPRQIQDPNAATTLSIEGTYCTQDVLALNELGMEFRTPLYADSKERQPIYFSVRYGTRCDCTVAIETSF